MGNRYDFDHIKYRYNTGSLKYDFGPQRKGRDDLLPLWVADMDFALPDEILKCIHMRVDHGIFGYTEPDARYYDAFTGWFQRHHGLRIQPEWNIVTPGVVFGIALAVRAFTKENESVLIQQPVYYPFSEVILDNHRRLVNSQLMYRDGTYHIDFHDFEQKIIDHDVKLFLLCNPHNPVGRVWKKEELKQIADICLRHDVKVFADEIHCDFTFEGYRYTPFLTVDERLADITVVGTSASKTFNLAGLQVANIFTPNPELRKKMKAQDDAAGYSQSNALGLTATCAAYEKGEAWYQQLLAYLQGNLDFVRQYLKDNIPQIRLIEPEGTYLIWLDCSGITSDYEQIQHIVEDQAKLWLDSGIIFGEESKTFQRINIATSRSVLRQALDALSQAVKTGDGGVSS